MSNLRSSPVLSSESANQCNVVSRDGWEKCSKQSQTARMEAFDSLGIPISLWKHVIGHLHLHQGSLIISPYDIYGGTSDYHLAGL